MEFSWSIEQKQIREGVLDLCARFGDEYWLARDTDGRFPEDFCQAIADGGWMGIACRRNTAAAGSVSPRRRS